MRYTLTLSCFFMVSLAFGQQQLTEKRDSSKLPSFSWYSSAIENDGALQSYQLPAPSLSSILKVSNEAGFSIRDTTMPIYKAISPDPSMQTKAPEGLPKQYLRIFGKEEE